ncbi:DUF805 domain-containing protein [Natronogracilivirgula saccharolytica]|uniref:DUF805 domain-containing protein n=1 Tax=Natronogracilivirga saccharolytica TaxID=2812953 RepID=A0A8J7RV61_9BACT|nr:DUF805 domain-containing protein [Natronogracilivirga saccharolytica]MBP3193542.1 DUF805 domain-containing protein [Natronogracilivirga saccharolytica]
MNWYLEVLRKYAVFSGWWLFISLIPLIGAIVLIIFMVQDSTPGQNQYGPNPKEMTL